MQKKHIRIMISGGGTGGHIYPAIAIADELKAITNERDELRVEVRSQAQKLDKQSEKL